MAKAFGVPLAAICASGEFIESFRNASQTITYSSPPSLVDIEAGLHSLDSNSENGDHIRQKLFKNICLIRSHFKNTDLKINGGIFPVQSLSFPSSDKANNIFDILYRQGIKTVLTTNHHDTGRSVTFVIRCDHSEDDIERLAYNIKKTVINGQPTFALRKPRPTNSESLPLTNLD
jgi:7-keto-8-aminopelargonate synthetase-like enzyme